MEMFRPRICRLFCIILFSFYGCKSNGLFDISKIICYFFIAFSLILSERIVFSPAFPALLTKCQTNRSTRRMLAPKYDWVDSEALLRRFAKYTLLPIHRKRYPDRASRGHPAFTRTSPAPNPTHFITFQFVDTALLLENETRCFCVSFSKDLTSADETIVFGR